MKNWNDYTEEDSVGLYDSGFDLEAVLNATEPAQDAHKMTPSVESQQVKDLEEKLEEMKAELQQQKAREKETNSKLEEIKKDLKRSQEDLKQQVQVNEGLRRDLHQELGHDEFIQALKLKHHIRLKSMFQVTEDLKARLKKEKEEKESLQRELTERQKVQPQTSMENKTKLILLKTQKDLKQQIQANHGLQKINQDILQITEELKIQVKIEKEQKEGIRRELNKRLKVQVQTTEELKQELEETKRAHQKALEDLKQQIQDNEGLRVDLKREKGQNGLYQIHNTGLSKNLKKQCQLNADLKKQVENEEKQKEALLEKIHDSSNTIESQQNQVQELSTALVSLEEDKSRKVEENKNLNAALKDTEELRQCAGAALEQLVQLYDKSRSKKRRFWRRR